MENMGLNFNKNKFETRDFKNMKKESFLSQ
jgi:hypothetical protein